MASFLVRPGYTARMDMEPDTCYRAVKSRDARFDGRFFTAVVSTGIFCRPVCPASTPKQVNCRFLPSAAAAMAAGFRPCLRCRPEAAPNSPAWKGVSSTVGRALRLIGEGALDTDTVEGLADRLGIGERHLRRLFLDHVGASPKNVAQTRRLLFAKKMITDSALPLTEIALVSGFQSIRRFNDAFLKIYGRAPRDLRRELGKHPARNRNTITLKLAYRPPYDWQSVIDFLAVRAIPGVEEVTQGTYRRSVSLGGQSGVVTVRPVPDKNHLSATFELSDLSHLQTAIEITRRVFDLDCDSAATDTQLATDPTLAGLVKAKPGLRVPGAWDAFEISVRAILGQQISVGAASTFARRLVEAFGTPLDAGPEETLKFLFPEPKSLITANIATIGLTTRRAETIRQIAAAFADGRIDLGAADGLAAAEEMLCAVPGIGPWTAQYIAMRALGDPDAFPVGDIALLRAINGAGENLNARTLAARAEDWRPWRAYAAMHLWNSDAATNIKTGRKK